MRTEQLSALPVSSCAAFCAMWGSGPTVQTGPSHSQINPTRIVFLRTSTVRKEAEAFEQGFVQLSRDWVGEEVKNEAMVSDDEIVLSPRQMTHAIGKVVSREKPEFVFYDELECEDEILLPPRQMNTRTAKVVSCEKPEFIFYDEWADEAE